MDLSWMKETLMAIFSWLAWSITNIFYRIYIKQELMKLWKIIAHLVISGFIWYLAWLICWYFWINWPILNIIVAMSSYIGVVFLDWFEKKKEIVIDTLIDKSLNSLWKK